MADAKSNVQEGIILLEESSYTGPSLSGKKQECPVEVLNTVLTHLKEQVPRLQPIHVHCFTGNQTSMKSWISELPRNYFGFTGLVRQFSEEQKKALRAERTERILLETDAPYFGFERHSHSTPNMIGLTANAVASQKLYSSGYIKCIY